MEQFVGKSGVRTLFNIECINGKAIRAHSHYKKESEILLLPGTYLRVVGKWSPAKDLYIIHLRETSAPRPFLEPPFALATLDTSVPTASATTMATPVKQNVAISKAEGLPSGAATASSIKPKKGQEFATPGTYRELNCNGRPCANCGKCRDWYYTGDLTSWKWIQNYKNWGPEDQERWGNGKYYYRFKRRDEATCIYYYSDGGHGDYYDDGLSDCLCEDNRRV
ncbi:unnamed protein product [Rotaria sordida]|uniref:Uncharacterized protein n=1 Tax=Rotaria sordida TaxID=392033 RepID=A0A816CSS3_9BILA|nr:unnamed protein product [Rotaria sordida]CAF1625804.1 unnamed protein product [Rotaria sordida]